MPELSSKAETIFDRLGDRPQVAALMDWTLIRLARATGACRLRLFPAGSRAAGAAR